MNKTLKWILISLGIIVVLLIVLKSTGVIGKEEGTKVTAEKAALRTIIETVNASGKIFPEVEVKVSPDISGEIVILNVAEGDTVKKGQVLAKIYADIYASQRDQAAAGVAQTEAQVANSNAQLKALKATLEQARNNFDRQKKLYDQKVISASEFEQAQQTFRSAEANYNAAEQGIRANQAGVRSAMASLNRASKDVGRATIVAPMDGVVSLLSVKKGERVVGTAQMAGTEMMRIADLRSIETQVDVGENDIPKVKLGDSAIVMVDAYNNRKFKGIVYKIANPTIQSNIGGTTVTNYKVHIRLIADSYRDLVQPGKPFPFRPNMSASADIQTQTKKNVLSVPINAVTTRDKKGEAKDSKKKEENNNSESEENANSLDNIEEVVFILEKDNNVKKIKVTTGIQDINNIEITSGIKAGDMIITGPYDVVSKKLREKMKVKVVSKEELVESDKKDK